MSTANDIAAALIAGALPAVTPGLTPALHASPSCGKTALCAALRSLGVPVVDSDDVIAELFGWEKWHASKRALEPQLRAELRRLAPRLLVTNIWRFCFAEEADPLAGEGAFAFSVWRSDVEQVAAMSKARGDSSADTEFLTTSWPEWTLSWRKTPPNAAFRLELVGATYLSDAVARLGEQRLAPAFSTTGLRL